MYIFTRWYNCKKPKKVFQQQKRYYQNLFKSDINVEFTYVKEVKKLTEEEKLAQGNPITIRDLTESVFKLPKDYTSWPDGLQVCFYCKFWNSLKETLFNAIQYAYTEGILHISAWCSILSLIPKKNSSDLHYIKSWKLIVLLNTDLKLLSKVVAGHLKTVLDFFIAPHQTWFIKGRHIVQNTQKY